MEREAARPAASPRRHLGDAARARQGVGLRPPPIS